MSLCLSGRASTAPDKSSFATLEDSWKGIDYVPRSMARRGRYAAILGRGICSDAEASSTTKRRIFNGPAIVRCWSGNSTEL